MRLRILPLRIRHVDAMADIERACFSLPWSRDMILADLANPKSFYLAAEEDGVLAGYAGMQIIFDEGHITNIAIAPGHRRRGIASRLLEGLLDAGGLRELSFLTLEVRVSNHAAISLYEKYGFVAVGLRPRYYEGPTEDALIMNHYRKG